MFFRVNRLGGIYRIGTAFRNGCKWSSQLYLQVALQVQPGKIFRKDLSSFMPKFGDNQSVMNPNLVYFSLMYILCAMCFSGHLELIN